MKILPDVELPHQKLMIIKIVKLTNSKMNIVKICLGQTLWLGNTNYFMNKYICYMDIKK